jgi:nucleoid-associated protein YgaU
MLGNSTSDPYPVGNEYLVDSWQSSRPKSARSNQKNRSGDSSAEDGAKAPDDNARPSNSVAAVLEMPEFDPPSTGPRTKPNSAAPRLRGATSDGVARSGNAMEYTIEEGDTLSDIARRFMGSAAYSDQLFEENKHTISDPSNIHVGQRIRIPASKPERGTGTLTARNATANLGSTQAPTRSTRSATRIDSSPGSERAGTYVVKEGDSLIRIAREHYGRDAMYLEILRANEEQLGSPPRDLQPGMVLRLP